VSHIDLATHAPPTGLPEHQQGGRRILRGHSDRFVQGQPLFARTAGPVAGDDLSDLGVNVSGLNDVGFDGALELDGARRGRSEDSRP
jgi:hypothetical protein